MKKSLTALQDVKEQYLSLFSIFDKAGVPAETRWRSLLLYLRDVKDYNHLSDAQKAAMQRLLTDVLKEKDFSEARLNSLLMNYYIILTRPYQKKIEELLREASEVITGFQDLMRTRYGDISTLEEETVSIVTEELPEPDKAIGQLRNAFCKVKTFLEDDIRNLEQMATLDGVTNIANRRAFDTFLANSIDVWLNKGRPLALALFDIDHFKKFNDDHGHRIGDQVLSVVGKHLKNALVDFDNSNTVMAARYGGEEFALVVSGPDAHKLSAASEKCRLAIKRFNFLIRDAEGNVVVSGLHITVSAGVAFAWKGWHGAYMENLIDSADKALYFAKQSGRDRAVQFVPDAENAFVPIPSEE